MATPNLVNVDEITPKNNSAVLANTNRTDIVKMDLGICLILACHRFNIKKNLMIYAYNFSSLLEEQFSRNELSHILP